MDWWRESWPGWSRRWYGAVARVVLGAVGVVAAAGLVLLAQFGATFKRTVPEWDAEAVTFLILGLILGAASVWAAWRPSRASLSAFVTVVVGVVLAGAIL